MRCSSGTGRLRGAGAGRAASGTGSRQVEAGLSCGASRPAVASGGAGRPALQVGNSGGALAVRLVRARKAGSLTTEQETPLDTRDVVETRTTAERLMDEISQLGHVPTEANTASAEEKKASAASEVCSHGGLADKRTGSSFGQACAG